MPDTVPCIIHGENGPFIVDFDKNLSVVHLKEGIKAKRRDVAALARQLMLNKIYVDVSNEKTYTEVVRDISQGLSKVKKEPNSVYKLLEYFKGPDFLKRRSISWLSFLKVSQSIQGPVVTNGFCSSLGSHKII